MMTSYSYVKAINTDRLSIEISKVFSGLQSIDYTPDTHAVVINFEAAVDQALLDAIIAAHEPIPLAEYESTVQVVNINEVPPYAVDEFEMSYFQQTYTIQTNTGNTGEYELNITWPYPIAILGGRIVSKEAWVGDSFSVTIAPKTLVGQLVEAAVQGTNTIVVNDDCAKDYVWKSDVLYLSDGTNFYSVGHLIHKAGNVLTTENPIPANFPAGYGLAVTTEVVPEYEITGDEQIIIGRKTNRGMRIPANLPMNIKYTNASNTTKRVVFALEWYA